MVMATWDAAVVAIITVGAAAAATTMVIDGELISVHSEKAAPVGGLFHSSKSLHVVWRMH